MIKRQYNKLSVEQKGIIKFLNLKGLTAEQICKEEQLKRNDGSPILKETVNYWIKRINDTGNVNEKPKSGRRRILNAQQESKLIDFIQKNNDMDYKTIKAKTNFRGSTRSINNYALRKKISKLQI
jgi:transposase